MEVFHTGRMGVAENKTQKINKQFSKLLNVF